MSCDQCSTLISENESLKAQRKEAGALLSSVAVASGKQLALKARAEKAEAERHKALEVIREYRNSLSHRHRDDWSSRCPTCIKADALLSRETDEVTR